MGIVGGRRFSSPDRFVDALSMPVEDLETRRAPFLMALEVADNLEIVGQDAAAAVSLS